MTAANWPLVAVEFVADTLYKAALGVPVVGGAVMVAALVGNDLSSMLSEGLRAGAGLVLASLFDAPIALFTFVLALAVMGIGGAVLQFLVKAGTLAVLARAERRASDELHAGSLRFELMRRAHAFDIDIFLAGVRQFGRRYVVLGVWLIVGYAVLGGGYAALLVSTYHVAARTEWISAFPLALLVATSALVALIALINLLYLLLRAAGRRHLWRDFDDYGAGHGGIAGRHRRPRADRVGAARRPCGGSAAGSRVARARARL
jgi:hypothetical protein